MKRFLLTITFLILAMQFALAQDPNLSQTNEIALLRNPALLGLFSSDFIIGVQHRNQWNQYNSPYITSGIVSEFRRHVGRTKGDYYSYGLTILNDKSGSIEMNRFSVNASLAYNKLLLEQSNTYLSIGTGLAMVDQSFDATKMTFSSQYVNGFYANTNPSGESFIVNKKSYLTLNAGVSLLSSLNSAHTSKFYIGASMFHINRPIVQGNKSDEEYRIQSRMVASFGLQLHGNELVSYSFFGNYQNQLPFQELLFGGMVNRTFKDKKQNIKCTLGMGVNCRINDAFIPVLKYENDGFKCTISYDHNTQFAAFDKNRFGAIEFSFYIKGMFKDNPNITNPEINPSY
jgi:type IX secretion system PorP/SprF family membrane protein